MLAGVGLGEDEEGQGLVAEETTSFYVRACMVRSFSISATAFRSVLNTYDSSRVHIIIQKHARLVHESMTDSGIAVETVVRSAIDDDDCSRSSLPIISSRRFLSETAAPFVAVGSLRSYATSWDFIHSNYKVNVPSLYPIRKSPTACI